ncbi:EAL and GGDEF domain-containing protein [Alkalimarinus sediminis]|uniref:EAL domain-containing protein n=1 Tax=Alkalimarinus sediminis TaxID=1632866 RepID=A0A9E8HL04_9ALTE|nr:bifunctional diguanylate cyclase/phosphodiesterase [Alkalimarinus sediminis]UZW74776.1 EAL domain-containing protein [Alkalimarinus sediminis]
MEDTLQLELEAEREKNKLLLDIINAIPEPILAKDWDGNFIFANNHVAQLYGTTPDKMIGKEDSYFTGNKQQGQFFKENVQAIMRSFEPKMVYEESTDKNTGEVRHYHSLKVPFKNSKDEPNIVVIAKDITEITKLKNLAEFNAKRLKYVLEVSGEGMWDWDIRTNVVFQNKRWEEITGVKHSEKSFEEFQDCLVEEDRAYVSESLRALVEENAPYDIEFRFKRPDNKIIWIWDRGQVVEFDADGKPTLLVGIMQDITEQKLNQFKVESMAFYDSLTKLPNRALLNDRLHLAIEHSKRSKQCGAVLFLDLDHFKTINDSYGHKAGDELLVIVAERLKALMREDDTVARFGGDEFVVVLNELDPDPLKSAVKAESIAHDVRASISNKIKVKPNDISSEIDYFITASIGITIFGPDIESASELLQLADLALYQAKRNGRDDYATFDPVMQQKFDYTTRLEKEMRNALKQFNFALYYQPQYDFKQNLVSAEALIRWNHPELGLVGPSDFITLAEESNLILPMGNWVLAEACQQLKEWQSQPKYQHLTLSINISAKQIWQKDFVEDVKKIVVDSAIDLSKLKLEITESVLLDNIDEVAQKLNALVEFGLSFSLDDFGTGYSSLGYLKSLPIEELKIDQSFIRDVLDDEADLIMVKSIIDLGKNFDLTVVAEGIESEQHFNLLKEFGCDVYQGLYFSRPLAISEFDSLM